MIIYLLVYNHCACSLYRWSRQRLPVQSNNLSLLKFRLIINTFPWINTLRSKSCSRALQLHVFAKCEILRPDLLELCVVLLCYELFLALLCEQSSPFTCSSACPERMGELCLHTSPALRCVSIVGWGLGEVLLMLLSF